MTVAFAPKDDVVRSVRRPVDAAISPVALLAALLVAAAYGVGAEIGFGFELHGVPTSLFWLPNATMFAVFLLVPPRRWWLYAMIAFPVHLGVELRNGVPLPANLMLFVTNLGDGMLGAVMVRRLTDDLKQQRFNGFRSVLVFLIAAIVAPMIVSFLDAAVMVGANRASDYWLVWQTRFRSNSLTNILWVPAVFLTVTRMRSWIRDVPPRRYLEAAALLGTLLLIVKVVFSTSSIRAGAAAALVYAPLPVLLWAALRFGTAGVSLSLLTVGCCVIWDAMNGNGPFVGYPPGGEILTLQVFLSLLAIPSLLLAGLLEERRRAELTVRESEAQYRSIFESTGDGVLITDMSHAVVAANPAFYRMTGYDEGKLRDTHPRGFFHLDDLQPFDAYLTRASRAGDSATQALCVREDGGLSRFEIHGRRFSYGGAPHVLSVVRDVTERERAYQELEQRVAERTRALSTVLEISKTVASTLELAPLLGIVLDQLQTIVKYTGATVLIQRDDGDVVILDHRGPLTPEQVSRARISAEDAANCPTLHRGSPLVVDDIRGNSPSANAYRDSMPRAIFELFHYARSVMNVPLRARDRVIGVLRIDSSEPNQYTVHDAELTWALANQAAVAIENARLYDQARGLAAFEERQRLARELHDSVTQTLCAVAMLGKILPETWARDPAEGRKSLANLDEMTQSALAEMRTLLLELRPDTLVESELGDLLRQLADAFRSRVRAPIQVEVAGAVRLPAEVHVTLYRVAQEALANASRHASAAVVRMSLACTEQEATLSVNDDGIGFEASEILPGHLGILIMRERTTSIGGSLHIDSTPGQGTTVIARWSMTQAEADATAATASANQSPSPTRA